MEQGYLLDTNIAIYLLLGKLPSKALKFTKGILAMRAKISVIAKIELLSWEERSELASAFVDDALVYSLDDPTINTAITIRRKYKTKLPDAIIATTCITHSLCLVTRDVGDFKKIRELTWTNPFEI